MGIVLAGLNHTTAPIEIREKLVFSDPEAEGMLGGLRDSLEAKEVFLLSTCNRTEVMAVFQSDAPRQASDLMETLCQLKPGTSLPTHDLVYEYRDEAAIGHLYRVAAGLDSLILGEPQILGQIRQAYALATRVGTSGLYINKIMHGAFHVGKRARTETDLGFGS